MLVEVTFNLRSDATGGYAYETGRTKVKIGDFVKLPSNWVCSDPIGRVVKIGSDYTGSVSSIVGKISKKDAKRYGLC